MRVVRMEYPSRDVRPDPSEHTRVCHRWRSEERCERRHGAHYNGNIALDDTVKPYQSYIV